MPVNGSSETAGETKPAPLPASEEKNARTTVDAKQLMANKRPSPRRRQTRQETRKANTEERFFLATANGKGETPALGRECANETEAIVEAFRANVNFYKLCEFATRTEISSSGEPILRKEAVKKIPAS